MNRLPILLFGVVSTMAVALLLLFLYRYASEGQVPVQTVSCTSGAQHSTSERKKHDPLKWLDKLAGERKPQFFYPVTEMEIKLPLHKAVKKRVFYRLLVKDLDPYKLFCLKELLGREGIRYAMFRKKAEGILIVKDLGKSRLKRVIRLIREYDVDIKIENYTKD